MSDINLSAMKDARALGVAMAVADNLPPELRRFASGIPAVVGDDNVAFVTRPVFAMGSNFPDIDEFYPDSGVYQSVPPNTLTLQAQMVGGLPQIWELEGVALTLPAYSAIALQDVVDFTVNWRSKMDGTGIAAMTRNMTWTLQQIESSRRGLVSAVLPIQDGQGQPVVSDRAIITTNPAPTLTVAPALAAVNTVTVVAVGAAGLFQGAMLNGTAGIAAQGRALFAPYVAAAAAIATGGL